MAQENRHKIVTIIFVAVLLVLGYMVYNTFVSGGKTKVSHRLAAGIPQEAVVARSSAVATKPETTAAQSNTGTEETQSTINVVTPVAPAQPTAEDLANLDAAKDNQAKYLQMVQDYQLARMQRLLFEADAAIATAKLTKIKTEVEAAKLEGRPAMTTASIPVVDVNDVAKQALNKYEVVFIGYQQGRWTAVLRKQDDYTKQEEFHQVTKNSLLNDGTRVVVINQNGMVLKNHSVSRFLTVPSQLPGS